MSWKNIKLIFLREVRDQLRDRRTLFMITILPVLLYPMLGLGMVEMMLTFSEQRRTVVVLNAKDLPDKPAFLDEQGIAPEWLKGNAKDESPFRVVTDLDQPPQSGIVPLRRGQLSREDVLLNAQLLATRIANSRSADESGPVLESSPVTPETKTAEDLSAAFSKSGLQVLIIVPEGYADSIRDLQQSISSRTEAETSGNLPQLLVVRNSADDKSAVAFAKIQSALRSWENSLRHETFQQASLPSVLQNPARVEWVEVARGEQVAANVWSKLFPAMLVIMALTGAFYPAIDLGAGEKERGTMETLLISPARRVELVLGKFLTIMLFSVASALMNLLSMGITGQNMASAMGAGLSDNISLEFPGISSLAWLLILLIPLAALFSALCLALATFAKSTKEGQYYLTPLLMAVMGMTMFCLSPAVEMTPMYSVLPVINVALLLKGLLLTSSQSAGLLAYAIPVLISSFGYSILALWWAMDLYNSEGVLFREAEKFDIRDWFRKLLRAKDAVPAPPEACFCFFIILVLQFVAMSHLRPVLTGDATADALSMQRVVVIQQLVMIACPAVFMGVLLTTSLRATFRLRMPKLSSLLMGIGLACLVHPLTVELSHFMMERGVFPELPEAVSRVNAMMASDDQPAWLLIMVFAVTPAICEELAFRGFILSGLARGGRLAIAIMISSMMFGIVHMIPQQVFNTAMLALVLGLLAVHSRSLFPAIAFHFCNNAIATLYSRTNFEFATSEIFFSRSPEGGLRYDWPTLTLCAMGLALLISRMIRDLIREQEAKRRGELQPYVDPVTATLPASGDAVAV
jgi:sodium transport system permease protein